MLGKPHFWLLLQVGDNSQHQGHEGYDDVVAEKYSWDSSVNRHADIEIGDVALIWDKQYSLGFGVFSQIIQTSSSKTIFRCPTCLRAKGKKRLTKSPEWRCQAADCRTEFDQPLIDTKKVISYTGSFENHWFDFNKGIAAEELREITKFPNDQNSIRPIEFEKLQNILLSLGKEKLLEKVLSEAESIRVH